MGKLYNIRNISVYTNNAILIDIAWSIYNDIYHTKSDKYINIYLGIHNQDCVPEDNIINIGIQTEQYVDYNGKKMWQYNKYILRKKQTEYDYIVEINSNNKSLYDNKVDNVIYGPYIFSKPFKKNEKSCKSFFIGNVNERRRCLLKDIEQLDILKNCYGEELLNKIVHYKYLLNLHYADGVYNEWPRIALAYKYSMVLLSEELKHEYLQKGSMLYKNIYTYEIKECILKYNIRNIIDGNEIKKIYIKSKYKKRYYYSLIINYLRTRLIKYCLKPWHRIHPEHCIKQGNPKE